jgi:hypothetical protein
MTTLYSAAVDPAGDAFHNEPPQRLFDPGAHTSRNFYAPSRDGRRIDMTNYGPGSTEPVTVTVNWSRLLKQ